VDKNFYILVQTLGPDDPQVKSIQNFYQMDTAAATQLIRNLAFRRGFHPDNPPLFALGHDLRPGQLLIGRNICTGTSGQLIGLVEGTNIPDHVAIWGTTRSGKTTLTKYLVVQAIKRGEIAFILARDREWRDILPLFPPEVLLYMVPADLMLNPLEIAVKADGTLAMSPIEWIGKNKLIFRSSVYIRETGSNILGEVLKELYAKKGVFQGKRDYPALYELKEAVSNKSVGKGRRLNEGKDSLLNRIDMLLDFLGEGMNVTRGRNVHQLFSRSILLDVSDMEDEAYMFLFNYLSVLLKASFLEE